MALAEVAPGEQQMQARIARQRRADAAAEEAVGAQDQDSHRDLHEFPQVTRGSCEEGRPALAESRFGQDSYNRKHRRILGYIYGVR